MIKDEITKLSKEESSTMSWDNDSHRHFLIESLKKGEVSICSTDTIYGFLSDVTVDGFNKINELKKIDDPRPFLILISSIEKIAEFVDGQNFSPRVKEFLASCWPGPLTVIFEGRFDLSKHMVSEHGTVAFRCPKHDGLLKILTEFKGLFSTSANVTGQEPPKKLADVDKELLRSVACVISDDTEGEDASPSTIIDLSGIDFAMAEESGVIPPFKVVREGAFPIETLKELYER